jgi:DNA-binding FrmR family transcriptional regulator
VPREKPDERAAIKALCGQITAVIESSDATPSCRAMAAIITAARFARRSSMSHIIAAAMIADYMKRGDPI